MKNSILILLLLAVRVVGAEFYVSPNGSDSNAGTKAKPFATIEAARDAVRELARPLKQPVNVWVRGGRYFLDDTFVLTPADSGSDDAAITYAAFPGETPVFSGGKIITGWKKLDEQLVNVSAEAKGQLWYAPVPKDWRMHYLFVNGKGQIRSRHPNNDDYYNGNWPQISDWDITTDEGQRITFADPDVLKHVPSNGDAEIVYMVMQYASEVSVLRDIDEASNSAMRCSKNCTYFKGRKGKGGYGGIGSPARIENTLIYLDEPGEWCVDTDAGRVYYWPDSGTMDDVEVIGAKLENLVKFAGYDEGSAFGGGKNDQPSSLPNSYVGPEYPDTLADNYPDTPASFVHHINIKGLTFKHADRIAEDKWPADWTIRNFANPDAAILVQGAQDCVIEDCSVLDIGSFGITLSHHAQRIELIRNEIGNAGSGGIYLCGYGPGTLDVNHNNLVRNNFIHDVGKAGYVHAGGIELYQSGDNIITGNCVMRTTYAAIQFAGTRPRDMNKMRTIAGGNRNSYGKYGQIYTIRWNELPDGAFDRFINGNGAFTMRNVMPYFHLRNNMISHNMIVEPQWWGMEGGALYSCPQIGDYNVWRKNLVYKSKGMPKSTILALDDAHVNYFTQEGNVVWIDGKILNNHPFSGTTRGAVPPKEDGRKSYLTFRDNHRADATNPEPFQNLYKEIISKVDKNGGWLVDPEMNLPAVHYAILNISGPKGVFFDTATITITGIGNYDTIRYTLDGSLPTVNSKCYDAPLLLENSAVLRVLPFYKGRPNGKELRRTYECVRSDDSSIKVNFQPEGMKDVKGYLSDTGSIYSKKDNGMVYGWSINNTSSSRKRNINGNSTMDTLIHFSPDQDSFWQIDLENGLYEVTACLGDAKYHCSDQKLWVENVELCNGLKLDAGEFKIITKSVLIRDGRLTMSSVQVPSGEKQTRVNWLQIKPATTESFIKIAPLSINAKGYEQGLSWKFYHGHLSTVGDQWSELPDLATMEPKRKGIASNVSLEPLQQKEYCGLMFDGLLEIQREGLYTFYLNSDDGSRLILDDNIIVDNDGMRGEAEEKSGNVELAKGFYPIRILYFQHKGSSKLEVLYEGPGVVKQNVPAENYYLSTKGK
jgi:hypothetical protein